MHMCAQDWCDGNGMCKDHEWKPGHSLYGICAIDSCDPQTGVWSYVRNGNACCGNGRIDFGARLLISIHS